MMEQDRAYMESLLSQQTHDVAGNDVKPPPDERQIQLTPALEAEQADLTARYTRPTTPM